MVTFLSFGYPKHFILFGPLYTCILQTLYTLLSRARSCWTRRWHVRSCPRAWSARPSSTSPVSAARWVRPSGKYPPPHTHTPYTRFCTQFYGGGVYTGRSMQRGGRQCGVGFHPLPVNRDTCSLIILTIKIRYLYTVVNTCCTFISLWEFLPCKTQT